MDTLKKLFASLKENWNKDKTFLGFITLNMLGNTIPVWFILLINIIEKGFSYNIFIDSIHQPFTFLVLGGSLLSNTLFLWQKDINTNKNVIRNIPILMLIYIFISLPLFGYLFIKTYNTPTKDITNGLWITTYIVSISAFIYYLIYQYKDFKIDKINKEENNSVAQQKRREESFEDLRSAFNTLKEEDNEQ